MFVYDGVLGLLGIQLTLSAARGFGSHKHTKNVASGVLDNEATVSHSEMIEHSFYQVGLVTFCYSFVLVLFHGTRFKAPSMRNNAVSGISHVSVYKYMHCAVCSH